MTAETRASSPNLQVESDALATQPLCLHKQLRLMAILTLQKLEISTTSDESSICQIYALYIPYNLYIYVVVQFDPWFNFDFPLFFSMLIHDNKHQTKENQN